MKLYMFRTVPLSIMRSFSLYTQQWYTSMSYKFTDSLRAGSGWNWFLNDIYHCCVYSKKTPDDGQRNCPKHVEFHFKNKFEKLVHLVGFIIGSLSRCTVISSNLDFYYSDKYIYIYIYIYHVYRLK